MQQFISGSDVAFAELERKARTGCVTFPAQELPPGAVPRRARVGFEIDASSGTAMLFVDRGGSWNGSNAAIREWISTGQRRFSRFSELKHWIRNELADCYSGEVQQDPPAQGDSTAPAQQPVLAPEVLTDLEAVQITEGNDGQPLYFEKDDIKRALEQQVRGQSPSLEQLSRRVVQHLAKRQSRRPLTVFGIGPTGSGKTLTAETLANVLSELSSGADPYGFLRLDMSEYQERHRISQLIGSPQGYVGYGEGAQLLDALAANPRTVVLFDEIEKAHPHVFRTLMNAMDAGRLSAASGRDGGRTIDCRRSILFFTSNLEHQPVLTDLGRRNAFHHPAIVNEVCRRHLKSTGLPAELISRISTFLAFQPITGTVRAEVVTQAVARVGEEYGLTVTGIDPNLVTEVLSQAEQTGFGSRPDEYLVEELIGPAFSSAAQGGHSRVQVMAGPPVCCEPESPAETNGGLQA